MVASMDEKRFIIITNFPIFWVVPLVMPSPKEGRFSSTVHTAMSLSAAATRTRSSEVCPMPRVG